MRTLKMEEVCRAAGILGPESIRAIAGQSKMSVKYGELTVGQVEALLNRVLADVPKNQDNMQMVNCAVFDAILRGEYDVKLVLAEKCLFDKNSRLIPFLGLQSPISDFDQRYQFPQYSLNYEWYRSQLSLMKKHYDAEFSETRLIWPTATAFKEKVDAIIAKLKSHLATAKVADGTVLPFVIPGGIGKSYFQNMKRMAAVFGHVRADRRFAHFHDIWQVKYENDLPDVNVFTVARHEEIKELVEAGECVIGVALPALGGYSAQACREAFKSRIRLHEIPSWLSLGGGYDTLAACITNIKIFSKAHQPTVHMPAVLDDQSREFVLHSNDSNWITLTIDGRLDYCSYDSMSFITCCIS